LDKYLYILTEYHKTQEYCIDKKLFKERLLSDPNNIVTSITNTLDYFEVKNIVAGVPKDSLNNLPNSFIAQVSKNNQFNFILIIKKKDKLKIIVNEKNTVLVNKEEFLSNWTGLIVAIEKNVCKPKKKIDSKKIILKTALIICILLAIFYISLITKSFIQTLYLIFSILGFTISFIIVKEKLNLDSVLSKFCTLTKNTDCETVLNSKEARIFGFIDLSDSSIIYFSFITLSFIYNPNNTFFYILSLLSLPLIAYSIYYQKFRIKKWCPLCLSIASILALQFTLTFFNYKKFHFEFHTIFLYTFFLGILILTWISINPLLIKAQKYNALVIENLTFRRNHHLFLPYYNSLKEIGTDLENIFNISVGVKTPIINLVSVTNPLCKNCKEAHHVYTRLLQKYPNEIKINFLFLVPNKIREDTKTKVSERLIQIYHEKGEPLFIKALNEWFTNVNSKDWLIKWGKCTDIKYNTLIEKQVNWCLRNEIMSTPVLIINGKLFPKTYYPKDIENFIEPILEFEKNKNIYT